ncbi:SDR family oxidoreductase [Paludibaculum fermentans]|uniref:SDR family oxidoreductase n=1 Tax=Paludibaculum fermentans TaxID=1473598 RepID=A0A7S7SQ13_PALFE|nr:SDR family oxidoreductase [Paludibaculum fermentans]
MKIVVVGGTGLIGSKVIGKLKAGRHEAVVAAPSTGVNTLTGEGLSEVLMGASAVIDVSNSPSFEEKAVMAFFQTSTRNLLSKEAEAGVRHHVALSVVGTERLQASPYMRAKLAQERLIKESGIAYSIVHATQFFEFVKSIADAATVGNQVHVPPAFIQPMAAEDVASAVAKVAVGSPLNGMLEVAGPERFRFDEFIRRGLRAHNDSREVVVDQNTPYFGAKLSELTLIASGEASIGEMRFDNWLSMATAAR